MTGPLRCRPPAIATVQVDDAHLRVTRWDFPPGSETCWHRHGMGFVAAHVAVPLSDGAMQLELPGGETAMAKIQAGAAYARAAGVEHNAVHAKDAPFAFVEIERKHLTS